VDEVEFGGHDRHWVRLGAMCVVEKVLTGQSVHTDDAVLANDPMLHALQVMAFAAPSISEAVPAGQSMHDAPFAAPKVPFGHLSTRRTELESVVMDPWLKPSDTN
jgi:hypothetical protein